MTCIVKSTSTYLKINDEASYSLLHYFRSSSSRCIQLFCKRCPTIARCHRSKADDDDKELREGGPRLAVREMCRQ